MQLRSGLLQAVRWGAFFQINLVRCIIAKGWSLPERRTIMYTLLFLLDVLALLICSIYAFWLIERWRGAPPRRPRGSQAIKRHLRN